MLGMTLRVLVAAPLLVTATAYAQAPGEWSAPPAAAAPVAVVTPAPRLPRWSVGLGVNGTELGQDGMDSEKVSFSGVSFAVRYRAWAHVELELLLGGGAEDTDEYTYPGRPELALGYGFFSGRYRFNPWSKWNGYLLAGVGVLTVAPKNASDDQLDAAQRAAFTFGGGIEYRFHRLAFQGELRGIAAAPTDAEMDYEGEDAEGIGGAQFTLSANLYF